MYTWLRLLAVRKRRRILTGSTHGFKSPTEPSVLGQYSGPNSVSNLARPLLVRVAVIINFAEC